MRRRGMVLWSGVATVVVALVMLGGQVVGAQTGWTVIGDYQLDESAGSTTLWDSSGRGVHGSIGSDVRIAQRSGGITYHNFPYVSSNAPANPARTHLITQNHAALNPGSDNFAVEVRLKTTVNDGNVTQKGQSGGGSYWKMELHDGGFAHCVFKGTKATVSLDSDDKVTNGQWRTVRCERLSNRVVMYVDGVEQSNQSVVTGDLTSSWEQVIGGKARCASDSVECDYFRGDLDYVRFEKGGGAPPPTTTTTTTTTAPPPTTTTPPVVPATRPPSGSFDSIEVDGRTITVRGRANDPDGRPSYWVSTTWDGKRSSIERQATPPTFSASFTAQPGDHRVCVTLLDNPTRQPVTLSCKSVTVK